MPVLAFNPIEGKFDLILEPGEGEIVGEVPAGALDGVNLIFTTASKFVHESPGRSVKVFLNGVRQSLGAGCDYTVAESGGPGTGFDRIVFTYPPIASDVLLVDYWLL